MPSKITYFSLNLILVNCQQLVNRSTIDVPIILSQKYQCFYSFLSAFCTATANKPKTSIIENIDILILGQKHRCSTKTTMQQNIDNQCKRHRLLMLIPKLGFG